MARQFFKDLPDTSTPLTASRLNGLLDGEEAMGNLVVDSIKTKNIFGNYTIVNGYLFETRMSIRTGASDRLAFIECKPNTTYTISRSVITTSFRVSDYTSIPQMTDTYVDYTVPTVVENNSGTTMTYTTSSTAKYLVIHYGNALNDTATNLINTLKTMQVEEGTTASTFSPYQNLNGFSNPIQLLGDTILAASTSYALSDNITNYRYIMLVLTSTNNFANANRQYIPVSQITSYDNTNRCALSVFQSTTVYMFADMYFNDATHIYCNTILKGSVGWDGHLKVYGII